MLQLTPYASLTTCQRGDHPHYSKYEGMSMWWIYPQLQPVIQKACQRGDQPHYSKYEGMSMWWIYIHSCKQSYRRHVNVVISHITASMKVCQCGESISTVATSFTEGMSTWWSATLQHVWKYVNVVNLSTDATVIHTACQRGDHPRCSKYESISMWYF